LTLAGSVGGSMNSLSDQVKENLRKLSDEALVKLIEVDCHEYTEEAMIFAREELARRRRISREKEPIISPPKTNSQQPAEQAITEVAAPNTKRTRFWGGVWLVLVGLMIYGTVLNVVLIIVGAAPADSENLGSLVFFAAPAVLCLWAGIKRRPDWTVFLGSTLCILAILAFVANVNLTTADPRGEMNGEAMIPTAIVLLALGGGCFLLVLSKRKSIG